jgi:TPR repeat protein
VRWCLLCLTCLVGCGGTPKAKPEQPSPAPSQPTASCTIREPERCEQLCEQGDPTSCSNLGVLLVDDGLGVPAHPARAAKLFEQACEAKAMPACANLGSMLARGQGVPRDVTKAKTLLKRACDAKVAEACGELGQLVDDPKLLDEACAGGSGRACNALGIRVEQRDPARAAQLFERACKRADPEGCANFGQALLDRSPPDGVTAAKVLEQACEAGSGQACIGLGGMALKGISPISQDHRLAHELFALGCERGVARGCFNVGLMYEKALALPPDGDSASRRFEQACKMGHEGGCSRTTPP